MNGLNENDIIGLLLLILQTATIAGFIFALLWRLIRAVH